MIARLVLVTDTAMTDAQHVKELLAKPFKGDETALNAGFSDAVNTILENAAGLRNDEMLCLYGLYKQSTEGDVKTGRPSVVDVVGGAKWDSWKAVQGAPKTNAMHAYIEVSRHIMARLVEGKDPAPAAGDAKDAAAGGSNLGLAVSKFVPPENPPQWSDSEALFKAITDGDLGRIKDCLGKVRNPALPARLAQ